MIWWGRGPTLHAIVEYDSFVGKVWCYILWVRCGVILDDVEIVVVVTQAKLESITIIVLFFIHK